MGGFKVTSLRLQNFMGSKPEWPGAARSGFPFDSRAVANLLLDKADSLEIPIHLLTLNKLLFFCHGYSLIERGAPLVRGLFEAWRYGPVHTAVYEAFWFAGTRAIWFRAMGLEPLTGGSRELAAVEDEYATELVSRILRSFGRMPPGMLIDIACASGSPWSVVTKSGVDLGDRIEDSMVVANFSRHLTLAGDHARADAADEPPFPTVSILNRPNIRPA